jgi:antitoxin (DNA-binding transcriptional repressor) of toxin-antitoxin stability system
MLTKTVDIRDVQAWTLKELLPLVTAGNKVLLTEGNTPVARLVPVAPPVLTPRVAGLHSGVIWTSDDLDEPLPDEFWTGNA